MAPPDQMEIVRFLASDQAWGMPVEHVETHISHLFLTADRAWKLKRTLKLNFLDFSTPDLRRETCEREVMLNRRTAPDLYLGVAPVIWNGTALTIGGEGEVLDWLIEMRRFDQSTLFHRLAERGELTRPLAAALAEQVIAFHAASERRSDKGGATVIRKNARDVADNLRALPSHVLPEADIEDWARRIDDAFEATAALLDARRDAGFVRLCHGDMHLANICVLDGRPALFDCIEFNDDIACIDVLFDLAFALMDLLFHRLPDLANLILSRYLSATRDFAGLACMPAFLSLRAAIRAMAMGMAARDEAAIGVARGYLALARDTLRLPARRLIAVGGLSGTGKSTLAAALAVRLAPGAGAVVISSDVIRKRLMAAVPEERLPPDAYASSVSEQVYARLFEDVGAALEAGQTVIADATFTLASGRGRIQALADAAGAPFHGIWLDAPEAVLRDRVAARRGDASDADVAVLANQLRLDLGAVDWLRLEATAPDLVDRALMVTDLAR
jgi:aminoglycoside phosphotransferase family enzyme/predicted kinase